MRSVKSSKDVGMGQNRMAARSSDKILIFNYLLPTLLPDRYIYKNSTKEFIDFCFYRFCVHFNAAAILIYSDQTMSDMILNITFVSFVMLHEY